MFIFRIIANLFGLATRIGFNILWLPIFLVTRNLFLTLILLAVFVLYLYFNSDDMATKQTRNTNQASFVTDEKGNKIQVATPVRTTENGDSAFANDLYRQMTKPEQTYYSQLYYWVMGNLPDGQTHSWSNVDIAGQITPSGTFKNGNGHVCRRFTEVLKVHAVQQKITGIACQDTGGGWCKLRANSTPSCGLGHQPGFMDSVSGAFGKLF